MAAVGEPIAETLRRVSPRLLASLIRLAGSFDRAEYALQQACARVLASWPESSIPAQPAGWLLTVARRVPIDGARQAPWLPLEAWGDSVVEPPEDPDPSAIEDDQLRLLYACCRLRAPTCCGGWGARWKRPRPASSAGPRAQWCRDPLPDLGERLAGLARHQAMP